MKLSKLRQSTSTRTVRGQSVPRQDTTSFGMRAALKKGGSRYAGDASGPVEGEAARHRLDRPGRKAGGRVCKADGGGLRGRAGESDVEVRQSASDRAKDLEETPYINSLGKGAALGAGFGAMIAKGMPIVGRAAGAAAAGLAGRGLADDARRTLKSKEAREAKESAAGNERKFGGRAKRKDGEDC